MIGPGKYDDLCTQLRAYLNADALCLIVLKGEQKGGFSFQTTSLESFPILARILREAADQVEKDEEAFRKQQEN